MYLKLKNTVYFSRITIIIFCFDGKFYLLRFEPLISIIVNIYDTEHCITEIFSIGVCYICLLICKFISMVFINEISFSTS